MVAEILGLEMRYFEEGIVYVLEGLKLLELLEDVLGLSFRLLLLLVSKIDVGEDNPARVVGFAFIPDVKMSLQDTTIVCLGLLKGFVDRSGED